MEKMEDKINGLRYQQYRLKQQMLDLDPKLKKAKGAEFFKLPEELDEDWVKKHQEALVEEQRVKIRKKFEKDNEKRATEGEPEMKAKELDERMEVADEMAEKFKSEWKKGGKIQAEGRSPTVEKLEVALEKLDQRAEAMKVQAEDRDNNKEVALGTSKIVSGSWLALRLPPVANLRALELHRPSSHSRLLEEVRCPDRTLLLQATPREV